MRNFLTASMAAAALTLAVSFSMPVLAADAAPDPSVRQIYDAAEAGHFDQAQQMMDLVLRDHPTSAKAHYVQAELYAKQGKTTQARAELSQAEQIEPGLTHENPKSVQALKSQLGMLPRSTAGPRVIGMTAAPAGPHIPWGTVLLVVVILGVLWMVFRRRSPPQYVGGAPAMGGGAPGGYGGPSGYGGPGAVGGGMGSGIAGGLASGLAVGAGVVAGEELAHHFMDGRPEGVAATPVENNDWQQSSSNSDMGGSDFGVNDAGGWDDSGGGGGGGGGDDWS